MSYTLSEIRPDDRRGMAQGRALLEKQHYVNGAPQTTKKLLAAVTRSSMVTLSGVPVSEADKAGRNDLIESRSLK